MLIPAKVPQSVGSKIAKTNIGGTFRGKKKIKINSFQVSLTAARTLKRQFVDIEFLFVFLL